MEQGQRITILPKIQRTIEKEENETVTDSFTADNENFEKVFEKTFYPHIDNTDGFYICKMKRIK